MLDWAELKSACGSCTRCGLCETRHNVVFGVGKETADVMLVGEGPGEQEDLKGEPFVGPAGKLLDDMLSIIDLERHSNFYLANIVNPRMIVLGGRTIESFPFLVEDVERAVKRRSFSVTQKNLMIRQSQLQDTAAMTGAALQVIDKLMK